MGRVYFPTVSLNRFGVRDASQPQTLGAVTRYPAEPTPRSAMTPTGPLLGGLGLTAMELQGDGADPAALSIYRAPIRIVRFAPPAPAPSNPVSVPQPIAPTPVVSSSGGGGAVQSQLLPAAPVYWATPVSQQVGPTPTATLPAPPASNAVLVSSGGGTQTPATAPAAAAPAAASSVTDQVAAWLGSTTPIFSYNVPNALLAGAVVLGFALLSSGKKR